TEGLDCNTASAAVMEHVNRVREQGAGTRDAVEPLLVMLAPYAPHFAEELWAALGHEQSVVSASWPSYDERLAAAGDVEIVVQVEGKGRGRLTISRGGTEAQVGEQAREDESVGKVVDGGPVRSAIHVAGGVLTWGAV